MKLNPLRNLLAANKGRGLFKAEANGNEATMFLYDVIVSDDYWGGVSALTFAKELASLDVETVHLRLDSPGGDVFASVAMSQAMREHKAQIVVHVDGYAASAATQLLMAADKSVISPGGMVMIHKAWTMAVGNADDMKATAGLLDKIDGQIADSYSAKTGIDNAEIIEMMTAETWMTETEAIDSGFVDALAEGHPDKQNKTNWDLSAYAKPPVNAAPVKSPEPEPTPADPPANNSKKEEHEGAEIGAFSISDHLRRKLRISEGAN